MPDRGDHKNDQLFHPDLATVVFQHPFTFYDLQIKAAARGFIRNDTVNSHLIDGEWRPIKLEAYMAQCELMFITCTIDRLILSRGRDGFDLGKEKTYPIRWG